MTRLSCPPVTAKALTATKGVPALVKRLVAWSLTAFVLATSPVFADDMADPHAMHHHMMMTPQTTRSAADYSVPDVALTRDDGQVVRLRDELGDGRSVVLAFIYTSCTTVCPLTSATLSELQGKLGAASGRVHLMSISIDPEQDTPARLREYATRFGAGPQWQHYTGTLAASRTAQQAFDVYRGDKMDHAPAVLVRKTPTGPWVRFDGFATANQLLAELPTLHAAN